MPEDRPRLAVLIDADNVPAKYADAILSEVKRIGEPALRRVYGDWSSDALKAWAQAIPELGLVARQASANTRQKNASDIGLVIDAMDILHGGKFDGFVLVSSDSDFTGLASRLREDGRTVIGIGEHKTPSSLRNVCNRFIFIENIANEDLGVIENAPAPSNATTLPLSETTKPAPKLAKPLPLFKAVFDNLEDIDGWYSLSAVGSRINAANPDFDPRSYGHSKLSTMVKVLRGLETKQSGTHLLVRLKQ